MPTLPSFSWKRKTKVKKKQTASVKNEIKSVTLDLSGSDNILMVGISSTLALRFLKGTNLQMVINVVANN